MRLEYFKDMVFELLNDAENMCIKDIVTNDREDKFTVSTQDGSVFEISCSQKRSPVKKMRLYWWMKQH